MAAFGVSRFIKKKESWKRFFTKALLVLVILISTGIAFASRFRIGIDTQIVRCIPEYRFYLLDLKDKELSKGNLYAFSARGLNPVYDDGTLMLKYLRGVPGDSVFIDKYQRIFINNEKAGDGLYQAKLLHRSKQDFMGEKVLDSDSFWFMGTSSLSFDSRYWGTVSEKQIIGRAYPIF